MGYFRNAVKLSVYFTILGVESHPSLDSQLLSYASLPSFLCSHLPCVLLSVSLSSVCLPYITLKGKLDALLSSHFWLPTPFPKWCQVSFSDLLFLGKVSSCFIWCLVYAYLTFLFLPLPLFPVFWHVNWSHKTGTLDVWYFSIFNIFSKLHLYISFYCTVLYHI